MACVLDICCYYRDVLKAKNGLKQYLTSINAIYAKYTEGMWAKEVTSAAAWKPIMHAYA